MIGAMHGSSSSSTITSVGTPVERNSATTLMTFFFGGRMNLTAAKLVFWQIPDLGSMGPLPQVSAIFNAVALLPYCLGTGTCSHTCSQVIPSPPLHSLVGSPNLQGMAKYISLPTHLPYIHTVRT